VGRDPFYLIGRKPNPSFRLRDLLNVKLAALSEVPTPWICLQHDLRSAGEDPTRISRAAERTMAENAQALRDGAVDVIQVFQPLARVLIDEGAGHLWYAAASRGTACYTTLNTTRDFIATNPDTVLRITRAMYRVQKWIHNRDGKELAQVVNPYLPDVPEDVLAACCNEYKCNHVWSVSPAVQREGLQWKCQALLACGAISRPLSYEDYVDDRFAQRVLAENPPSS
jgi:NitT/TauT family transport system substrate-binding protein